MARRNAHTHNQTGPHGLHSLQRIVAAGVRRRRDQIVEIEDTADATPTVAVAAVGAVKSRRSQKRCLLIVANEDRLSRIESSIHHAAGGDTSIAVQRLDRSREPIPSETKRPTIVVASAAHVIDKLRRDNRSARSFSLCIIDALETERAGQFGADLQFIYTKLHAAPTTIAFVPPAQSEHALLLELLRRPGTTAFSKLLGAEPDHDHKRRNEEQNMSDQPFDKSALKNKISEILREIHEEEDPIEMTRIKRMIRKQTSVFNRGYIMAYLLKQALSDGSQPRKRRKERPAASEDHQSIFVSIGRNKRVHTRDLITFFTSADGITRDDVGQIKVLDNYSFVEVTKDKAQAAIEALNGQELRGRKLTVNFARRK